MILISDVLKFALIVTLFCAGSLQLEAQVVVKFPDTQIRVVSDTILLGDIATVQASQRTFQAKLQELDLDKFEVGQKNVILTQEQIRIRLMLAGCNEVQFEGPEALSVVRVDKANAKAIIENKIASQLSQAYSIPQGDLQVLLESQFKADKEAFDFTTLDIRQIQTAELPLGRQNFQAAVSTFAGESFSIKVPAQVALFKRLAVAKANIPQGATLTKDNVESVRRPVTSRTTGFLSPEFAFGKQAQSDIEQYTLIKPGLVKSVNTQDMAVIKRNTYVDAIIRRGALTVRFKEIKTLEDGKRGARISVANPNTNERMAARVIDANTVEIR